MKATVDICIDFGDSIPLSQWANERPIGNDVHGIYLIYDHTAVEGAFNADGSISHGVIYIGKAIQSSIASRCKNHYQGIVDARKANGEPKVKYAPRFYAYRDSINKDAGRLSVLPGRMSDREPFKISCAEEYLIHHFALIHKRLPLANTAGGIRGRDVAEADPNQSDIHIAARPTVRGAVSERVEIQSTAPIPRHDVLAMLNNLDSSLSEKLAESESALAILGRIEPELEIAMSETGAQLYSTDTAGGDIRVRFRDRVVLKMKWQPRNEQFLCAMPALPNGNWGFAFEDTTSHGPLKRLFYLRDNTDVRNFGALIVEVTRNFR